MAIDLLGSDKGALSNGSTLSSLTISNLEQTAANNRVLAVTINWCVEGTIRDITSVTYNSIGLTQKALATNSGGVGTCKSAIYTLAEASLPSNGTYDVVVTFAASMTELACEVNAQFYQGVDQTKLSNTTTSTTDNSSSHSTALGSLDTGETSWVIDSIVANETSGIPTEDSGQNDLARHRLLRDVSELEFVGHGASYEEAGTSSSATLGWSGASSSADWAHALMELVSDGEIVIQPSGFNEADAFGSPGFNKQYSLTGVGFSSALGSPTIVKTLSPTGFNTTTGIGSPVLFKPNTLSPIGVGVAIGFGTPSLGKKFTISGFNTSITPGSVTHSKLLSITGFNVPVVINIPPNIAEDFIRLTDPTGTFSEQTDPTGTFVKETDPTGTFTRVS